MNIMQNISKHWPIAKKMCRSVFLPKEKGFCFFETDYCSMEVGIGCCYHNDQNMLKYLKGHGDMHRDAALDIFLLHENEDLMTKVLRQGGKNGFVFPEFYGDYYGNCANELWKNYVMKQKLSDGTPVIDWMKKHGIGTFDQFKKHMREVERVLQEERFTHFFQWRKDMYAQYIRDGHYVSKTGFPYFAIMDQNDAANYPIQGSAFHCNLYSITQIRKEKHKRGYKSYTSGEIHDSIIGAVHPDEINDWFDMMEICMVDRMKDHMEWVTSPVGIDIEMAMPDRPWTELRSLEKRPELCSCGLKYGYSEKEDKENHTQKWICPICGREEIYELE